jgi:thiopurine S-methyltransferase|tara:strand:- start:101 stop:304 length:204 start_codon:yes stop_codon:yes gene_type:complete
MEKKYWEEKWQAQELGFHLSFVHPILKRNLAAFDSPAGATVFLSLCGDAGYRLAAGAGADRCRRRIQ